jgi:protein-S-isoprenylcysteine O-methyltransferase Ste14
MRALRLLAGIVLAFEMPVPIYWLILHARVEFWRRHMRAGFLLAILIAWGGGDWLLYHFRGRLFHGQPLVTAMPPMWAIVAGLILIAADAFIMVLVELELGGRRLVGHAELTHSGELATRGLYAHVRHPRYFGTISAVLGGCLLAGSLELWIVAAIWLAVALGTIRLEERELRLRFGPAYATYAKRIPALLPFRIRSQTG